MSLLIRKYIATDREEVVKLWTTIFDESTGHNDPGRSIDRKTAACDGLFFVAVAGRALVGTIMAGYDGHRGWLYSLAVAPNFQRQGIGSKLVEKAESALAQLGCPKINLQIRADNLGVTAFYNSLGFENEERISMGKRTIHANS